MKYRTAVALMLAALLIGCAEKPTEYGIGSIYAPHLSKQEAEKELIEKNLQHQKMGQFDSPITVLSAQLPDYPRKLRAANVTGTVIVKFLVNEKGYVESPTVVNDPPPQLASLMTDTISSWTFRPLTKNGEPQRAWLTFRFIFVLDN